MARPNILFFFTDQQRWDTTGLAGNSLGLTPNLDRLGREGLYFPLAFTPQPVCGPARSCLQSGQFATQSGCYRNGIPLAPSIPTLAESFAQGGYDTAYIGKWHLGEPHIAGPVAPHYRRGYHHWLASNTLEHTSDAYRTSLWDGEGNEHRLPGYRVDALADAAIRHLCRPAATEKPWFLFLSFLEPHHQNHRDDYPAPLGYAEHYANRSWIPPDLASLPSRDGTGLHGGSAHRHMPGYCGMVKRLDEALGRIEEALRSTGQWENTLLVFTSDHGCHFKTRNGEYKRSPHDASLRVPLVLHGPASFGRGQRDHLVSLLDLPPTLLEAAELPVPPTFQGHSLLPLARDPSAPWQNEIYAQISESQTGRALRTRRWKYAVAADQHRNEPCATSYRETELYDLQADPWELNNLVEHASHSPVAEYLRSRLLNHLSVAGEPPATIAPPEHIRHGNQYTLSPEDITA